MTQYEPGTVAIATVCGVEGVRVLKSAHPIAPAHEWFSVRAVDCRFGHRCTDVTNIRPLVVLDLHGANPKALVEFLRGEGDRDIASWHLDGLADQIKVQTQPPKPPEPTGLFAAVKDRHGERWINYRDPDDTVEHETPWVLYMSQEAREYADIDVVEVLTEGVPT